jgi:hypothetical protein
MESAAAPGSDRHPCLVLLLVWSTKAHSSEKDCELARSENAPRSRGAGSGSGTLLMPARASSLVLALTESSRALSNPRRRFGSFSANCLAAEGAVYCQGTSFSAASVKPCPFKTQRLQSFSAACEGVPFPRNFPEQALGFQIPPVCSNSNFYEKRHAQRMNLFHLLPHQGSHHFDFRFWDLEHQLIVHLQRHP